MEEKIPYTGVLAALLSVVAFVLGGVYFIFQSGSMENKAGSRYLSGQPGVDEKRNMISRPVAGTDRQGNGATDTQNPGERSKHQNIGQSTGAAKALLQVITNGSQRSDKNKSRDIYRHPVETLDFFGLRPNMKVAEIWPGGGWYTEIIAPYVKDNGAYIGATRDSAIQNANIQRSLANFRKKFVKQPKIYGQIKMTDLSPSKTNIAPENSLDMILSFRNVHNWMKFNMEREIFAALYKALKPGGVLGMVEHRQNPDVLQDPQALSGYVTEDYVIEMVQETGFKLAAKSEINANAKDSRSHPAGVWTLPPVLRLREQDKARYLAIGESDRMTLKFVKPLDTKAR